MLPGYEFSGWETTDAVVTDEQFAMPDTPVTFTVTYAYAGRAAGDTVLQATSYWYGQTVTFPA